MKNKVLMGLAAIAMVAFLSSCGKVPQEKIDAVNAAIAAAQTAEAAVYVPAEFTAVQDSMKAIMAEVEVQNGKLFKKFGPVTVKLDATLAAANQVAANAAVKKEEVKKEVETLMTGIKATIAIVANPIKTLFFIFLTFLILCLLINLRFYYIDRIVLKITVQRYYNF